MCFTFLQIDFENQSKVMAAWSGEKKKKRIQSKKTCLTVKNKCVASVVKLTVTVAQCFPGGQTPSL